MASSSGCERLHRAWRAAALLGLAVGLPAQADALYRGAPIRYGERTADDAVTRLQERLAAGEVELRRDATHGYLRGLLDALAVPVSSQALVFSKTSLQHQRISPDNPRAVYFGEDAYVGFVPGGSVLEVTVMDARLGPVFYTLDQQALEPRFERHTELCLACHASGRTAGWPGHLVRSVFADAAGHPLQAAPGFVTTHQSPLAERWGGWYVTGTHGAQRHMGNVTLSARPDPNEAPVLDVEAGANREVLPARVDPDRYLSPHSDLVALMVLEHQAHVHNVLARAGYEAQRAQHRHAQRLPDSDRDTKLRRDLHGIAADVLEAVLLRDEARLDGRLRGTSAFAEEFAASGPRDRAGRSLRELDLEQRLFRYPCSYLIYSPSFDTLPPAVLDAVYTRMWRILTGRFGRRSWPFTREQRQAILEILLDTKKGLPASWHRVEVR